ncbi:aminotransferase class I/II-fold pyridoxal phosphate-dependent enzyme [Clostridium culturomicium]|uniref:aminotransferase class I/II-fold pyridoxal phosphate-dependent enzyme n=1 Tax=Clostridium culturomicium TaxID=1499683 RepID=UPI003857B5FF
MPRLPIVDALLRYKEENNSYFAMPGHKCGKAYEQTDEGRLFLSNMIDFDVTEVDGMDNFHNPEGIIKEAQKELSNYYQSKKSYFLVNGSTSGNMIMIFSVFNEHDKIIVERNCHRSVYNSIVLRKLKPIYIRNKISESYDAPFSIDKEHLFSVMEKNKDAKGILLTYPNYYGLCSDLEEIIEKAREYKMKVLIDSAHGAHFGVSEELPVNAVSLGADMVVHSAHKTLPSLTQTSFLHLNCEELIEKVDYFTSVFSTTSPSYLFMASLDYSRYYLQKYGTEAYENLIKLSDEYREKINRIGIFHVIGEMDINKEFSNEESYCSRVKIDKSRYIINLPRGYSGHALSEYLKTQNIQAEMSDHRNVILLFATSNTRNDFEKLYGALKRCNVSLIKDDHTIPVDCPIPMMKVMPWEAIELKKERCMVEDALDKICGQAIVPYPPGIPLVMPGELISQEVGKIINYYIENNVTLLGIEEGMITVLKK